MLLRVVVRHAARLTEGYSASDLTSLVREASFLPLRCCRTREMHAFMVGRELGSRLVSVDARDIRPLGLRDFQSAVKSIRASVSPEVRLANRQFVCETACRAWPHTSSGTRSSAYRRDCGAIPKTDSSAATRRIGSLQAE